ncbi:MAG TPA: hypothetical protein VF778_05945 [Xanthobacteraceae bacterium]
MSDKRDSPAWQMIAEMSGLETGAGMLDYLKGPMAGFVTKVEAVLAAYSARIEALEAEIRAMKSIGSVDLIEHDTTADSL